MEFNILTNSARSCFLNCRKKFYWQYIKKLIPIRAAIPFIVGGLVHNGLELFYKGELDLEEYGKVVAQSIEESIVTSTSVDESEKIWIQEAIVMGILTGYVDRYAKTDKKWKVIAPETEFLFELENGLKYSGKRDLLIIDKKKGLGLVEHKTTTQLNAGYLAKLPLDNQILIYSHSVKKEFKKYPDFILYNVMKKTGLRKKQGESFEQFKERIMQEYKYNLAQYFHREFVPVNIKTIKRSVKELERFAVEFKRALKIKYFYMNTTQCTAYGACPYMPLCLKQKHAMDMFTKRDNYHSELDIETKED